MVHNVVMAMTAAGGVGVLLVMVLSGMVPLTSPELVRVPVRARERSGGR